MLRGEIYWADLEPTTGSEANKVRPVVVVSNNGANAAALRFGGVVTIIPLTSAIGTVHPFQVLLTQGTSGLTAESKAQAEQVRTVSVERLRDRVGFASPTQMKQIDDALRLHLGLA